MFESGIHWIVERIISLSPAMGATNSPNVSVEFGAKIEICVITGYLRIRNLRWDSFNEGTTLQTSVEFYRKSYGHHPARTGRHNLSDERKPQILQGMRYPQQWTASWEKADRFVDIP